MSGAREAADEHVHPTLDDPVAAALSEGVGGPIGRRATRHPWWTPTRVVLLLVAICFALGMVQKSGGSHRSWVYDEHRYTHMAYTDLPYLYTGRGLVELDWPYSDDPAVRARYPDAIEYPVGIAYFAYGAAWVTQQVTGAGDVHARSDQPVAALAGSAQVKKEQRAFVDINALAFAALALLSAWLLAGVHRRRPWDAVAFAASPALALTGIINWDLLAVAMVAGALFTWARGRPVATGVLVGLGTATKLYPVLFLVPLIRRLAGRSDCEPDIESAVLGCDLPENDERADYLRAALTSGPDGIPVATPFPVQDSSMLTPLAKADCLLIREPYAPPAGAGSRCAIVKLGP